MSTTQRLERMFSTKQSNLVEPCAIVVDLDAGVQKQHSLGGL